ncbi:uncharacterized protein [Diabrotica undecimpunctata]|uniref:uncharacterized protein n=1 Tax=Diabrotica undecimpunctata TaxID=50387 RepID=UPI003B63AF55
MDTNKQKQFLLATYNIQLMAKDEKVYELEELSKIKWDIVEVKIIGEQCMYLNSGNRLYYTGKIDETYGGIGFGVKKYLTPYISTYKSVSDRVAYIIIDLDDKAKIKVIQVHAPTTTHQEEVVEMFYEDLITALAENDTKYTIITSPED